MSDGDSTRAVHAGHPEPVAGQPLLPGPVFAAPFHLGDVVEPTGHTYGRSGHPTLSGYESALSSLEGAPAVVFPSGMAAIAAVLYSVLKPGDRLVVPADGYYGTRALATQELSAYGVEVHEVSTVDVEDFAAAGGLAGVRLLVLETPSNPGLDVCDIAAISRVAAGTGTLVAVDNSTATPLGQSVLALGATFALSSDTKALTGHSDILLGHVATADPDWAERILAWRTRTGAVPGPFEVWLAHRSLGTLDLRLTRQAANARAVADALVDHPAVTDLRYPGRPADPAYRLASRQLRRPIGLVSFTLADAEAVRAFVRGSRLAVAATSFGGMSTTVDRRAQWGGDAVPPGFLRLSCGIEDTVDLVADLVAAADSLVSGR